MKSKPKNHSAFFENKFEEVKKCIDISKSKKNGISWTLPKTKPKKKTRCRKPKQIVIPPMTTEEYLKAFRAPGIKCVGCEQ